MAEDFPMPTGHHLHLKKRDLRAALETAENDVRRICDHESVGQACRAQCRAGATAVIGAMSHAIEGKTATMQGKLVRLPKGQMGIIVSPFEDCPKNFEQIIVKGGRNKRVKICRLGPDVRKKYAPPGKPAHKGPLRRKTRPPYRAGVTARDIERAD
jgi:hypothetical protein